jgi:hypothetical protein
MGGCPSRENWANTELDELVTGAKEHDSSVEQLTATELLFLRKSTNWMVSNKLLSRELLY